MCGACLCDWVDRSVRAVDRVSSSVKLKRYVATRRKLPNLPTSPQQRSVTIQKLHRRISNGSASKDSYHQRVPRVGALWDRRPGMDRTKNVTFSHVSYILGQDSPFTPTGPFNAKPPCGLRELQRTSVRRPPLPLYRQRIILIAGIGTRAGTGAGTAIKSSRSEPLKSFVLGLSVWASYWRWIYYHVLCAASLVAYTIHRN